MKEIKIVNRDLYAKISDIDYVRMEKDGLLNSWVYEPGSKQIRRKIKDKTKQIRQDLHRYVLQTDSNRKIHHIDGDLFNCQRENLYCPFEMKDFSAPLPDYIKHNDGFFKVIWNDKEAYTANNLQQALKQHRYFELINSENPRSEEDFLLEFNHYLSAYENSLLVMAEKNLEDFE